MVIWVNGAFGAGKTSLVEKLKNRWPQALVYDPELTGSMLFKILPQESGKNFQDLPIWRSLVASTILQLRQQYQRPLLVPMTLVDSAYLAEIFDELSEAGETIHHYYLDIDSHQLRDRIRQQIIDPKNQSEDEKIKKWRLDQIGRCMQAASTLPEETVFLDSGTYNPEQLADQVVQTLV